VCRTEEQKLQGKENLLVQKGGKILAQRGTVIKQREVEEGRWEGSRGSTSYEIEVDYNTIGHGEKTRYRKDTMGSSDTKTWRKIHML